MRYELELIAELCEAVGFGFGRRGTNALTVDVIPEATLLFWNDEHEDDCGIGFEGTDWHTHGDLTFVDRGGRSIELTYLDTIAGLADGCVLVGERWLRGVLRDRWLLHRDYPDEFEHMDAGEEIRVRRPIVLDAKSRSRSDVPA